MKQFLLTRFVNFIVSSYAGNVTAIVVLSQVLLMPEVQDLPEFQALDAHNQTVFLDTCYNVRRSVLTSSSFAIDEQCRKVTILVNAALFNGSLGKGIIHVVSNCTRFVIG